MLLHTEPINDFDCENESELFVSANIQNGTFFCVKMIFTLLRTEEPTEFLLLTGPSNFNNTLHSTSGDVSNGFKARMDPLALMLLALSIGSFDSPVSATPTNLVVGNMLRQSLI